MRRLLNKDVLFLISEFDKIVFRMTTLYGFTDENVDLLYSLKNELLDIIETIFLYSLGKLSNEDD